MKLLLCLAAAVLLVAAKLAGIVDWSWWWVTVTLWGPVVVWATVIAVAAALIPVLWLLELVLDVISHPRSFRAVRFQRRKRQKAVKALTEMTKSLQRERRRTR